MPNDLVNTHGKGWADIIINYFSKYILRKEKSKESYPKVFETDCNKHDICYDCVSKSME